MTYTLHGIGIVVRIRMSITVPRHVECNEYTGNYRRDQILIARISNNYCIKLISHAAFHRNSDVFGNIDSLNNSYGIAQISHVAFYQA